MFGDLHVHSSYSFDSYVSSQRNDPSAAYRYAKGDPIHLPDLDGEPTVRMQLRRPLDFASITDHSEFLGEMNTCTENPWSPAYWTPVCMMTRSDIFIVQLLAASHWADRVSEDADPKTRSYVCRWFPERCNAGLDTFWSRIQRATEEHYDRSSACAFTTFVGYEYTDAPGLQNLHRNVIFRNENVTARPVSAYDTGARNFPRLWELLRERCIDSGNGCDVLAIPHNSNLSGGLMFPDPRSEKEALDRLFFEPVIELIQHKAASECRFDRLEGRGLATSDELCTFEQNRTDNLASLGVLFGEMQTEVGRPVSLDEYGRRNMVRNALKDGLVLGRNGLNPFKMGFIGSTDTHSAIPGATDERDYVGHLGRRDAGYRNLQDHLEDNPGGLAVVWAEENSRDSIFEGLRRKETYATSGTRPTVRFFGGWDFEPTLCGAFDLVAQGYRLGVPMGSDLPDRPESGSAPRFVVSAQKDAGTGGRSGSDLQRIQIIKGWVDTAGRARETVYEVAGSATGDGAVNEQTCEPEGRGFDQLCAVWSDPDFDPAQAAFYYARVLENQSCRWSTHQCMAAGVNPFASDCRERAREKTLEKQQQGARGEVFAGCCLREEEEPFYSPLIQERAWTSPIWYEAREKAGRAD
ncbi:MAG: DUF3604 domain-containing protein [bacterium]|nr:DUF3604 domain-containing protein [bacterium]